jgi:hypothetical protein
MTKGDSYAVINELLNHDIPRCVIDIEQIMETLIPYANDAIKFRMKPEVVLYYSDYFYGTTDAICFNEKTSTLRIHDYKSGSIPAKIDQLDVYAALYCIREGLDPDTINIELRIYQSGEIIVHNPEADEIEDVMNKIKTFNSALIRFLKEVN